MSPTPTTPHPSVSVVIPAYNSRFLEEAITSVYAQTYPVSVMHHDRWDPDPDSVLELLLTGHWCVGTMSVVMFTRDAFSRLPPFDERLLITGDISMYLDLVVRRMRMAYLPESLVEYRWHGTNISRDVGRVWEEVCAIYDRLWQEHADEVPEHLRARAPALRSHWHLQTGIDAIRHGDRPRARRHILKAARIRPSAIRPGWVRMLGIGPPPTGSWPE